MSFARNSGAFLFRVKVARIDFVDVTIFVVLFEALVYYTVLHARQWPKTTCAKAALIVRDQHEGSKWQNWTKGKCVVSREELMVSTLAMTDGLAKLLIEKGVISQAEFKQKAAGGAGGISPHCKSDRTVTIEADAVSSSAAYSPPRQSDGATSVHRGPI